MAKFNIEVELDWLDEEAYQWLPCMMNLILV